LSDIAARLEETPNAPERALLGVPEQPLPPIAPLHDPMLPVTVLYDEKCEFCRWTATELRRWDVNRALRVVPFQEAPLDPILRELLRGHDLADHVHVLDGAGRLATGSEAFLAITAVLPGGAPVVRLFELSRPAAFVLDLGYRVLNRRRGVLADVFGLNGPRLREPDGFDALTTDVALSNAVAAAAIRP
jgi:predicted DCC family thiol-disulfide oxidoreductase YuxK